MAFYPQESSMIWGFLGIAMSLKKVLVQAFITLTVLQATITEVEAILNDRPLTYLSPTTDNPEPLTPSHLLCERRIVSLPHPVAEDDEESDPDYYSSNQIRADLKVDRQAMLLQHFQSR